MTAPHFCCGILVDKNGTIVWTAPILGWVMKRKWKLGRFQTYINYKKWVIEVVEQLGEVNPPFRTVSKYPPWTWVDESKGQQMKQFSYDQLQPDIRSCVRWLRERGWETVDSGDGSAFASGMEGAMKEPMVAIRLHTTDLKAEADLLYRNMKEAGFIDFYLEASYSPLDKVPLIVVFGEGLRNFGGI